MLNNAHFSKSCNISKSCSYISNHEITTDNSKDTLVMSNTQIFLLTGNTYFKAFRYNIFIKLSLNCHMLFWNLEELRSWFDYSHNSAIFGDSHRLQPMIKAPKPPITKEKRVSRVNMFGNDQLHSNLIVWHAVMKTPHQAMHQQGNNHVSNSLILYFLKLPCHK